MALRLGDAVIRGEIINTSNYSVHGWLQFRDREHPCVLELTGNCDVDLAGWHIRFEARGAQNAAGFRGDRASDVDFSALAWQQVGPTGTMTAARKVKVSDCPPGEFYQRCKLGEPPPTEWKRCLYLEWFSQNGRVVVELADPIIEFVEFIELQGVTVPPTVPGSPPADAEQPPTTGLGITSIRIDDEDNVPIHEEVLPAAEPDGFDDDDDPYGLIPDTLKRQFDIQAYATDRALDDDGERAPPGQPPEDKPRVIREMELMDDLIENSPGVPLSEIFDGPLKLPLPEQANDEEAEEALKVLLAQLAVFGISLHLCDHFTPRDAYRLLLTEICPEATAFPELRNTQWVQGFCTSEYCEACDAEFEREYQQDQRRRKENPGEDVPRDRDVSDDDIPF